MLKQWDNNHDYHSFANSDQVKVTHLSLLLDVDFAAKQLVGQVELQLEFIDKKTTERMLQRVENTKSERDSVDLIFAFGLDSGFSVSGVQERAIMETDSSVTGLMPTSPVCALGSQVAGAVEHVIENEMSVCGVLPNDALCQGGIYFGGGTKMLMCTDITLGAMKTC